MNAREEHYTYRGDTGRIDLGSIEMTPYTID